MSVPAGSTRWADLIPTLENVWGSNPYPDFPSYYRDDFTQLIRFTLRLGASLEEAEDFAQDAMHTVLVSWSTIGYPPAFARRVTHRQFFNQRRKEKRLRDAVLKNPQVAGDKSDTPIFSNEAQHVLNLLNTLPPAQRTVMAWTYDGYQPTEIAQLIDQPAATVRSHLRHARETLKDRIRGTEQNDESARKEASDGP